MIACPCHGSNFTPEGKKLEGPRRGRCPHYSIALTADGELQADKLQTIKADRVLKAEESMATSITERTGNPPRVESVEIHFPPRARADEPDAKFGRLWKSIFALDAGEGAREIAARSSRIYLGSLSFLLFIILVITGVLLMFYYHPAAPKAYHDMKDLRFVVSNGVFLRNMHRIGAHLMVLLVFWHMFHVFYRGGYKPPHEFDWVIGVVLLMITLFLSYTGYLLPWDQLAFWAVTVGTNIISAMPVVGSKVRFVALGGNIVGENALLRFYVLHVVILPLLAFLFIGVHFWRVQKDGGLTVKSKDDDGTNQDHIRLQFGREERASAHCIHHAKCVRKSKGRSRPEVDDVSAPAGAQGDRI